MATRPAPQPDTIEPKSPPEITPDNPVVPETKPEESPEIDPDQIEPDKQPDEWPDDGTWPDDGEWPDDSARDPATSRWLENIL